MMANEEIDYKLAAEQLRTGKPLFGKDGALAQFNLHYLLQCFQNSSRNPFSFSSA